MTSHLTPDRCTAPANPKVGHVTCYSRACESSKQANCEKHARAHFAASASEQPSAPYLADHRPTTFLLFLHFANLDNDTTLAQPTYTLCALDHNTHLASQSTMKYWKRCDGDFHSQLHTHHAIIRDEVMSIGFEGYADFTAVSLRIVPRFQTWSSKRSRPCAQTDKHTRKSVTSMRTSSGSLKRPVSPTGADGSRSKKARTLARIDEGDHADGPFVEGSGRASKVATTSTSKSQLELEQSKQSTTKADKSNATSKPGKKLASKDDDGDSDDLEIVEIKTLTPDAKRKQSVTSHPEESAKKRPKTIELKDTEDEDEVDGAKDSPAKRKNAPRQAVANSKTRPLQIEDSDEEDSESEKDGEGKGSEYGEDEPEDPQAAQKLAQAKKELGKACKTCRTNASRAMKQKYELEISKLKREHQATLRNKKEDADEALKSAKANLKAKNTALRTKHDKEVSELKSEHADKVEELKEKKDKAVDYWDEKYKSMKQKFTESNNKLTKERDDADAKRKTSERETSAKLKVMTEDTKAAELRLKEERKQMIRDNQEEIDQLKPEHSTAVKNKEKLVLEFADKVAILENRLSRAEHDLGVAQSSAAANNQRYKDGGQDVAKYKAHVQKAEDKVREFDDYLTKFEGRSASDQARLQEKLDMAEAHLQQQKNRVVTLQRENYVAHDTLRVRSQLCAESNAEVKRLKDLLRVAQAEVGLAAHLDGVNGLLPTDTAAESPSSVEDLITFD